MNAPLYSKLSHIRLTGTPRVLDLFAGCGGLSLGFQSQGFDIVGGVEIDPEAATTYASNLHPGCPPSQFDVLSRPRDIRETRPADLLQDLLGPSGFPSESVDVIVGGPPCQSFARVGRAKLREIMNHPQAFLNDERASLYAHYLEFVADLKPLAVLMENVPDILNYGGANLGEEICEALEDLGYDCAYTLLNAAHYGVPQMRTRVFILGLHRALSVPPSFPAPSHKCSLPSGYEGTKQVALRTLSQPLFIKPHYIPSPEAPVGLPDAVTAEEAIGDLPPITDHLDGRLRRGIRFFNHLSPYRQDVQPASYARAMRHWLGFQSNDGVLDHVIRFLPRDWETFKRMRPGDQYPQAYRVAIRIFEERRKSLQQQSGTLLQPSTPEYERLWTTTVPPYDPGKFPNKWRKMEPDKPARTLMAHIGKDTYSHIHYDSDQARTISVREAARLQSFPDGFTFCGHMNSAFRQIGNAVPPVLAAALARHLNQILQSSLALRPAPLPVMS